MSLVRSAPPRRDVLSEPVLILNKSYQPVRITSARNAFLLLYGDRAHALDQQYEVYDFDAWSDLAPRPSDLSIRTPTGELRVPRLMLLRDYNRVPRTPLRLSRRNVFLRDGHACMYCEATGDLTIDHVQPRSRGGDSTWENLVACCRRCNLSKGQRTPNEAGMKLRNKPVRPTWTVVIQLTGLEDPIPDWEPFLAPLRAERRKAS